MPDSEDGSDEVYEEPLHPWGRRVSFRAMLEGKKKLVLIDPPSGVSDYFKNRVFRSHGCTYDDRSCSFFVTSPGTRNKNDGQILQLQGNCSVEPVVVASGLAEPAAIAIYEPGRSVCAVTNRGIYVFTREGASSTGTFKQRQISYHGFQRGIAVSEGGGIVSFCKGKIYMYDGNADDGQERVLAEADYNYAINRALFEDNQGRRGERANCCFMDIVDNQLVMSDLQKHVISLWAVKDRTVHHDAAITYVGAIDVAITCNPQGSMGLRGAMVPKGKLAYASGIRLDAEGWVMCADADGRTIQIFDDQLKFVKRVAAKKNQLPYISGLYIDVNGHLMVCDRKSEMGGLRVYMMEPSDEPDDDDEEEEKRNSAWQRLIDSFAVTAVPAARQAQAPAPATVRYVTPPQSRFMPPPPVPAYQPSSYWAAPPSAPFLNSNIYDPYLPPTAGLPREPQYRHY